MWKGSVGVRMLLHVQCVHGGGSWANTVHTVFKLPTVYSHSPVSIVYVYLAQSPQVVFVARSASAIIASNNVVWTTT